MGAKRSSKAVTPKGGASPLPDPFEHFPFPALRLGTDGTIVYANHAAKSLATHLNEGMDALLPAYHDKYLADALAHPNETLTACARHYDAATVLQWSYRATPDGRAMSMFAADVSGLSRLSETLASTHPRQERDDHSSARDSLLHRFIEHVPIAAAMFDKDMRYLLASRRWKSDFDFLPSRLEGLCHYDLIPVLEDWRSRHCRALAGEDTPPVEVLFTRPDTNRSEWLLTQALPWTRDDGKIGGILIFAEIITPPPQGGRGRRGAATSHSETTAKNGSPGHLGWRHRARNQFADPIHQRQPGLPGNRRERYCRSGRDIPASLDRGPLPESQKRIDAAERTVDLPFLRRKTGAAVRQALSGVHSISRIVTAIKTFSHPGTRQWTPININNVIRDAIVVSCNQWKHLADIEENLDDSMPVILGHGDQLGQVVLNLIVNAIHAIEDAKKSGHGTIRLSSYTRQGHAIIQIEDNGIGIPQHLINKIFEPFYTTKAPGRGTGQGLSIAHTIVTRGHGGEIHYESAPGHFTRFTINLPYRTMGSTDDGTPP